MSMSDDGDGYSASDAKSETSVASNTWQRVQRARALDPTEQEDADVASSAKRFDDLALDSHVLDMFDDHCNHMQRIASARQTLLGLRLVTHQDGSETVDGAIAGECVSFVKLPSDRFIGDARLRCVRALLAEVDERGVRIYIPSHTPFVCSVFCARFLTIYIMYIHIHVHFMPAPCSLSAQTTKSVFTTPLSGRAGAFSTAKSGQSTARLS